MPNDRLHYPRHYLRRTVGSFDPCMVELGMTRARGPVGYTCPKIDACIYAVERAIDNCTDPDMLSDLLGRNGLLEAIRDANDQLRDWGAEQEDLATEREKEIESLEGKLERLTQDLAEYKSELKAVLEQLESA